MITIKDVEHQLEDLTADLDVLVRMADQPDSVIEFTRGFVKLREIKDKIEEALEPFNKAYLEIKDIKLPAAFEAHGVPTVNLEEGYRVTVAHNVRASIRGGQKEEAIRWLRENGLADIVSETVNASTLSAVAKTMAEDNRELDAGYFNVHVLPTTSVTKTKK